MRLCSQPSRIRMLTKRWSATSSKERRAPNHMIGCQALTPWDKRILASNVSGACRNLLVLPALFQNNIAPIPGSSAAQNGGHVCF